MSKVKITPEMIDVGFTKEKMRHTLRRIETKHKERSRRESAKGYRGYMIVDSKPVYQKCTVDVPERVFPEYEHVPVNVITDDGFEEMHYVLKKVGEYIVPAHTHTYSKYIGQRDVKPYLVRLSPSRRARRMKKIYTRLANKRIRSKDFTWD